MERAMSKPLSLTATDASTNQSHAHSVNHTQSTKKTRVFEVLDFDPNILCARIMIA
jgi:hypothetical protein